MAYPKAEQETTLVYESETNTWTVYSTVPKHIRKLTKISEVTVLESDEYGPKAVKAKLSEKQVSMRVLRELSEEQREQLRARALSNAQKRRETSDKTDVS